MSSFFRTSDPDDPNRLVINYKCCELLILNPRFCSFVTVTTEFNEFPPRKQKLDFPVMGLRKLFPKTFRIVLKRILAFCILSFGMFEQSMAESSFALMFFPEIIEKSTFDPCNCTILNFYCLRIADGPNDLQHNKAR